jgi:hypothetical protein
MIGPEVMPITSYRATRADGRTQDRADYLPITIGSRCWLSSGDARRHDRARRVAAARDQRLS